MAKYATTEKMVECQRCHINAANRELIDNRCPNCGWSMYIQSYQILNIDATNVVIDLESTCA